MKINKTKKGFTLIELLIVVAIIAILAAIAIPNFLAAQVRSKVSRAHAELRVLTTAMESYYIDANAYPPFSATNWRVAGFARLTSPVAYITSIPNDPFKFRGHWLGGMGELGWYWSYTNALDLSPVNMRPASAYTLWSIGPDLAGQIPAYRSGFELENNVGAIIPPFAEATPWGFIGGSFTYDPTNGVTSLGDIWRASRHSPGFSN